MCRTHYKLPTLLLSLAWHGWPGTHPQVATARTVNYIVIKHHSIPRHHSFWAGLAIISPLAHYLPFAILQYKYTTKPPPPLFNA